MWSCCRAEGTLAEAAGRCEQRPSTKGFISGATQLSYCQRFEFHHSLPSFYSQILHLDGAFGPKSGVSLDPEAGSGCSMADRTPAMLEML